MIVFFVTLFLCPSDTLKKGFKKIENSVVCEAIRPHPVDCLQNRPENCDAIVTVMGLIYTKPQWKGTACRIHKKKETLKRPLQSYEGTIARSAS
jgi:hypothetical protein